MEWNLSRKLSESCIEKMKQEGLTEFSPLSENNNKKSGNLITADNCDVLFIGIPPHVPRSPSETIDTLLKNEGISYFIFDTSLYVTSIHDKRKAVENAKVVVCCYRNCNLDAQILALGAYRFVLKKPIFFAEFSRKKFDENWLNEITTVAPENYIKFQMNEENSNLIILEKVKQLLKNMENHANQQLNDSTSKEGSIKLTL